jgi:hypothetical protein
MKDTAAARRHDPTAGRMLMRINPVIMPVVYLMFLLGIR